MTDVTTIARRYIDLWNERTASRRREILSQNWTADARYVDPLMSGDGHDGERTGEADLPAEARVRHVHPVEAGHERRDRDDGGPARDLLGDDVQPVALDGQVGLQDAVHQVPQAVGPFGGAEHVIVDVLVVGHEIVGDHVQVAAVQS